MVTIIDNTWPNPKYDPKYISEQSMSIEDALCLVLLFYTVEWTDEKKAEWLRITGTKEASTKVLCDHVRSIIEEYYRGEVEQ